MNLKPTFLLAVTFTFAISATAQNYAEQYDKCSASLKNLKIVDSVYFARAEQRNHCLLGANAPQFEATTLDGKTVSLSDLKGKVVFLSFWFTGCQPCIEEMPGLNHLVEAYVGKKVAFISFTYNSTDMVKTFLKDHSFKFQIVADNDSVRRNAFKLFSVWPYNIIIDKNGKIAYMDYGSQGKNSFTFFNEKIKKLL